MQKGAPPQLKLNSGVGEREREVTSTTTQNLTRTPQNRDTYLWTQSKVFASRIIIIMNPITDEIFMGIWFIVCNHKKFNLHYTVGATEY